MKRAPRLAFAALFLCGIWVTPARAGAVAYTDAAGDATALGDTDLPRPSDPELDLLEMAWSTTADELVVVSRLSAIGEPVGSNGWAVAHQFDYEGINFEILIQDVGTPTSALFPDGVYLRVEGDSTIEYPCVCRYVVEPGSPRIRVTVELHSIGTAVKAIQPRTPRPTAGSEFTELESISYRVTGFLLAADRAAAPEDARLIV